MTTKKTSLHLLTNPDQPEPLVLQPPPALGQVGRALWTKITGAYNIADAGGQEMLYQACAAADRAEGLREQVKRDGTVLTTRSGIRIHPAVKEELAARGFIVKTLTRMGLNFEPVLPVGRPGSGGLGIDGIQED
jgi:hypothetical protein